MFETGRELLEKIRLGEDSLIELKEVLFKGDRVSAPNRDSLADELAAFGNSRGGVCVLGVDDMREVRGIPLESLDAVEALVRQVCADSIEPPLVLSIQRLTLPKPTGEEAAVIKIDVPRSLFVHRSPGGYLHRVGSSRRTISTEYLARLLQQRSQSRLIRFDEQTVSSATLDALSEPLWSRFQTTRSQTAPRETFLRKLGMARQDDEGAFRPTVAGILLASEDPREWIPNAFIQCVAYVGKSVAEAGAGGVYQLDAADVSGPLDRQVADAYRFVARNMRTYAIKHLGRTDIPQYDLSAVFEALVNAVAHRDYGIYGSKIRLRIFADRLELNSPGGLPNTMEIESLSELQSARNDTIASLLAKCRIPENLPDLVTDRKTLMDRRGEGVPTILERSETLSGKKPEYRVIDDAELKLTIFAANPLESCGS